MTRHESELCLTAAMSGLITTLILLGAILVWSVGPAEKAAQVIAASERSEARTFTTPGNRSRDRMDIGGAGLRGSVP
jgi:hypothetical protein